MNVLFSFTLCTLALFIEDGFALTFAEGSPFTEIPMPHLIYMKQPGRIHHMSHKEGGSSLPVIHFDFFALIKHKYIYQMWKCFIQTILSNFALQNAIIQSKDV